MIPRLNLLRWGVRCLLLSALGMYFLWYSSI